MARLLSRNLVPPGGWQFPDGNAHFRTDDFQSCVDLIANSRKSNGKPLGDPAKELEDYTCQRWPEGCGLASPDIKDLAGNFWRFIQAELSSGVPLVSDDEANRRAAICAACPRNVQHDHARGGCATCKQVANWGVQAIKRMILQGKKTRFSNLMACQVCGCDNEMQVWIPKDVLEKTHFDRSALPPACWKK